MRTIGARTVLYAGYYTTFIQYRGLFQQVQTGHDCDGFRLSTGI